MKHTQPIRFHQPLRAVRLADANAQANVAQRAVDDSEARIAAAAAAVKEHERQERASVDDALAGLAEAAEGLTTSRNQLLAEFQQAAIDLATAIAARITYEKLESDRFAIEELAHAVVQRLGSTGPVQVHMHPDDLALLNRRVGESRLAQYTDIQLIPDATLGRGDCVADAGDVTFASLLEEQINGIRQHLLRNFTDAQIERRKTATGDRGLRRFPDRRQTA